jgi:hypothetical protein
MNHSTDTPIDFQANPPAMPAEPSPASPNPLMQFETYVRQPPGGTLLAAAGLGLLAVVVARAVSTPSSRNSAVRLLEDIQHRLAELAQPAYDRVSGLAEDGAHAFDKGVHNLGALHLDRKLNKLSRRFMGLFR